MKTSGRTVRAASRHVVLRTAFCTLWGREEDPGSGESLDYSALDGKPCFSQCLVSTKTFFPAYSCRPLSSVPDHVLFLSSFTVDRHSHTESSSVMGTFDFNLEAVSLSCFSDQILLSIGGNLSCCPLLCSHPSPCPDWLQYCQFLPGFPSFLKFTPLAILFLLPLLPSSAFEHNGIYCWQ